MKLCHYLWTSPSQKVECSIKIRFNFTEVLQDASDLQFVKNKDY